MRLIDADKTYKELIDSIEWLREQDYEAYSAIGDDIRTILDKQPTAFDVDKVVEQLDDYLFEKYCVEGDTTIDEIVKGGGVE